MNFGTSLISQPALLPSLKHDASVEKKLPRRGFTAKLVRQTLPAAMDV